MKLSHIPIAIAAGFVLSGWFLFEQDHQRWELLLILAGIIYLYVRWHSYKRVREQARTKNN